MYLCSFKALRKRQWGEYGWQSFSHHGFSTSRRTNHYYVVPTGGSDFKCPFYILLSTNIGKIKVETVLVLIEFLASINEAWFWMCCAFNEVDDIHERVHTIYIQVVDNGCFPLVLFWHNEGLEMVCPCTYGYWQGSAYWQQSAVKSQFSCKYQTIKTVDVYIA